MVNKDQFHLNQSNIQDLIDCPRRFQLKTMDQISWPVAPGEPISKVEELIELGNQFHSICHRFFTSIDPDLLAENISDPDLLALWRAFLPFGETLLDQKIFPEIILSGAIDGSKFTAKYDLIAQDSSGHFTIYDWKTSAKVPSLASLEKKAQSIIYPYLFVAAGAQLFEVADISPAQVSMRYFYPLAPEHNLTFVYSEHQHQNNLATIKGWLAEIKDLTNSEADFPLTDNDAFCQRCGFRSICDRNSKSQDVNSIDEIDLEDLSGTHFDFGQIVEIEY